MLTNNQNSTLQQLFATSAAQVETVATFFTGTAAEFWRTLEQHPVTWEARPQVNGQVPGNNRPGWDDYEAGPGLKALLLTKFRNAAYIQETWNKLSQMKFHKNGEEDLETFATRMDAYLKTVGLTYQENNLAINGTRANHLFAALPDWLTQKIKEQGLPQGCPHYSWCFAQVQRRAREILAAQAPRNQEHKKDNQDRRNPTRRNDQKNDQRYDQRYDQRNQRNPRGPRPPTEDEKRQLREKGLCFICKKAGHISVKCPEKRNRSGEPSNQNITVIGEGPEKKNPENVIKVQKIWYKATIPTKAHPTDAGYDLYSSQDLTIPPSTNATVRTGIAMQAPRGTYIRLAERSSLAKEFNIGLGGGVVDQGFTGEIRVILRNFGDTSFEVKAGQRIAQAIIEEIHQDLTIEEVPELSQTDHGKKGFGSTNKPPSQKVTTMKEDDENWYKRIADGYAPCGRCPHSIRMYCMEHVGECHACLSKVFKIQSEKC
jgi:dUTP pyrophosphatase